LMKLFLTFLIPLQTIVSSRKIQNQVRIAAVGEGKVTDRQAGSQHCSLLQNKGEVAGVILI